MDDIACRNPAFPAFDACENVQETSPDLAVRQERISRIGETDNVTPARRPRPDIDR